MQINQQGITGVLNILSYEIMHPHMGMGQNLVLYPFCYHQNSWDLWMFINVHPPQKKYLYMITVYKSYIFYL